MDLMKALGLSILLASPAALALPASAPSQATSQSAQAMQGTWQQACQHFPGLQVLEYSWPSSQPSEPIRVSQTQSQALQAFDGSKYTYWDARVLADFWKISVGDSKLDIGQKVIRGGRAIRDLDNKLADARTEELRSRDLHIFQESGYSFSDAAALATFWGEANPFEAKLRIERKLIFNNDQAVRKDLAMASKPVAPPVQPDFLSDLPGSRWNYSYRGQTFQFDFGQTNIENFSNGWWPGVSWQPNGSNQLRLWNAPAKQAAIWTFDSPNSFTGSDWDGSPITGTRLIANANPTVGTGQISQLQPTPSQLTGNNRPEFRARFSSPPDPRTVRFVVDRIDHSNHVFFSKSGDVLSWSPKRDLAPGSHVAEITAVGANQESFSARWTFTTPGAAPVAPPALPTAMNVNNLQAGEILGSRFTVRGRGVPGSNVVVRVEYPKQDLISQLSGVMLRFQAQGSVAPDGTFLIQVDAHEVPRGEPMNITVTDSANSPPFAVRAEKGAPNQAQRSP